MAAHDATAWFPGGDVRARTQAMFRVRQAVLTGRRPDAEPRSVIGASWRRVSARGLDPGGEPALDPLDDSDLIRAREQSGLHTLLPQLRSHLLPAAESAGQLMVVANTAGRVLWREGTSAILKHADGLGFVGGSAWTEGNVGTNAIGTCIVTGTPVHIHGAEHYAETHTPWTCAAAPLHDPLTGRLLGVVDLSGPAHTVHAGTLSLVNVAARLAELEIRSAHQERLTMLRAVAAPILARMGGKALVVAQDGAVAAVTGLAASEFIPLPSDMAAGPAWLPALGHVTAEPLRGGWLLRLHDDEITAGEHEGTSMVLDLSAPEPVLRVSGSSGSWTQSPSPRHVEILLSLLRHREGRSAAQLADDLFADSSRTVTVRAEMSRLRRTLGPLLQHQPYRIAAGVEPSLLLPADVANFMSASSAPIVTEVRGS
ncbi:MAG: GAF domain-containing protein [Aeromicrobium sp.]